MNLYVTTQIVPESTHYLTPGKLYQVIDGFPGHPVVEFLPEDAKKHLFSIVDDDGCEIVCNWNGCEHLEGGVWDRVSQESQS